MTYIEFFDKVTIENVCATLINPPERVVLIGDKSKLLKKHAERYESVLRDRGYDTEFLHKAVNKNDLKGIVKVLEEILDTYEDCAFDLTGGDELYIAAVGIISERYKDRGIQVHRFNIQYNKLIDCDGDGKTIMGDELPYMSVRENIRMYGGDIIYDDDVEGTTHIWNMDKYFIRDIHAMWDICSSNCKQWNYQTRVLDVAELYREHDDDPLTTTASIEKITENLKGQKGFYVFYKWIFYKLLNAGLIKSFSVDSEKLTVTYKNEQVKKCLIKSGQALEMKVYAVTRELCDEEDKPVYNDVMTGVTLDWDGNAEADLLGGDTKNEVDAILMKGIIPIFVSCKNGHVEVEELFKLNSVAEKFGSEYAKKILVASALNGAANEGHIRQRASDMGITVISDICHMDDSEFRRAMDNLWNKK